MSAHDVIILTSNDKGYQRISGVVVDGKELEIEAGSHISMTGGPLPSMVTVTMITKSVTFEDRYEYRRRNYLDDDEKYT
jgi:hypothetical protein